MIESLPSRRFANVDVQEVENFTSTFDYNFFRPDERENDSGTDAPASIQKRTAGSFDNFFVDSINFQRFIPRFVRFSWKPAVDEKRVQGKNNDLIDSVSIAENFDKIHNEQTFIGDSFTNIFFQDTDTAKKLDFFIKRVLEEVRENKEPEKDESKTDVVNYLNAAFNRNKTASKIDRRFLYSAYTGYFKEGYSFLNKTKTKRKTEEDAGSVTDSFRKANNDTVEQISSVKIRTQINNKIIHKALKTTSENSLNLYNEESAKLLSNAKQIQQEAAANNNSSLIDGRDYDFEVLEFLNFRKVDPNAFDSTVQTIGYVIDKWELNEAGELISKDPIIIENPRANSSVDLRVRYGTNYVYSIRSIAFVELQVEDSESNSVVALSFLISSKPSQQLVVNTEETIPPPPPADFNVDWCVTSQAARIMWNFPVNTQRDIKHFQVFRRSSLNEPFQLLKMYSFDDSTIKTPLNETPDQELVENVSSPKNYFIDTEFSKDSAFIYTVACLDAHGYSSNYSTQIHVSFNRFTNKIEKTLVSLAGAPKAYPNAYLQEDTFVDTIKTSGFNQVKVVFNPEFLTLTDNENNDLGLVKTDNNSEYRLQLINTDLQEQQVIKIKLKDRRLPSEKDGIKRFVGSIPSFFKNAKNFTF